MKKTRTILLALSLILGLTACDPLVFYHYSVKNNSNSAIKVTYNVSTLDTSLLLAPGKEEVLFVDQTVEQEVNDFIIGQMYLFGGIQISNAAMDSTNFNPMESEFWEFKKTASDTGKYLLTIEEEHF